MQLFQAARNIDRPHAIAKVALQLADDRWKHVSQQLYVAVEVETLDRLDQAYGSDLNEVVELLSASRVPSRDSPHEGHEMVAEPVSRGAVAVDAVRVQEGAAIRVRRCLQGGHA